MCVFDCPLTILSVTALHFLPVFDRPNSWPKIFWLVTTYILVKVLSKECSLLQWKINCCHYICYYSNRKKEGNKQRMSCEGACAHSHVQYAVARVRAKWPLKHVCKVRAHGPFSTGHTYTRATTLFLIIFQLYFLKIRNQFWKILGFLFYFRKI